MNVTIWARERKMAIDRLFLAYGCNIVVIEESPLFSKNNTVIGFKFTIEQK